MTNLDRNGVVQATDYLPINGILTAVTMQSQIGPKIMYPKYYKMLKKSTESFTLLFWGSSEKICNFAKVCTFEQYFNGYTVVCKKVQKNMSLCSKMALGEVGVSLP